MSIRIITDHVAAYRTEDGAALYIPGEFLQQTRGDSRPGAGDARPLSPGIYPATLSEYREYAPRGFAPRVRLTWSLWTCEGQEVSEELFLTAPDLDATRLHLEELGIWPGDGKRCLTNIHADLHIKRAASKAKTPYSRLVKSTRRGGLSDETR